MLYERLDKDNSQEYQAAVEDVGTDGLQYTTPYEQGRNSSGRKQSWYSEIRLRRQRCDERPASLWFEV
jgi:hypothetical protein